MSALTIGGLFAGVGGLELGLERGIGNGAHTVFQVEQNAYCRAVLAKHWPDARRFDDVRTVGAHNLPPVDVLCGGFPCQDVSTAGLGAGISEGTRSGLWSEFARIIRELRPRYVVVENVAGLLTDGMGRVLGDLADIGYDAEWSCISACAVGAPHMRTRVFVVAYPSGEGWAELLHHRGALHLETPREWPSDALDPSSRGSRRAADRGTGSSGGGSMTYSRRYCSSRRTATSGIGMSPARHRLAVRSSRTMTVSAKDRSESPDFATALSSSSRASDIYDRDGVMLRAQPSRSLCLVKQHIAALAAPRLLGRAARCLVYHGRRLRHLPLLRFWPGWIALTRCNIGAYAPMSIGNAQQVAA